ncbi:MAG: ABC transporter permease [Defluviitaleaceae bacterium]|nr:ABC transporter permease [Defluviitaleaceae bacterium]
MMNMIRADMYRIIRGKGMYITFAVLIVLNILVIGQGLHVGINYGYMQDSVGVEAPNLYNSWHSAATVLYNNMNSIIFFLLPIVIMSAGAMFANRTVKNDIAWGMSRTRLYLSKLLLAVGLSVILVVFYMLSGMIIAIILRGFDGSVPSGYWQNLFQTVGSQLLVMLGATSLGIFMVFTFKRSSAVIAAYIALCLIPSMIIMMLSETVAPGIIRLMDFDLMFSIVRLGSFSQLDTHVILSALGVGAAYIAVCTIGGIALFKRAEIK